MRYFLMILAVASVFLGSVACSGDVSESEQMNNYEDRKAKAEALEASGEMPASAESGD